LYNASKIFALVLYAHFNATRSFQRIDRMSFRVFSIYVLKGSTKSNKMVSLQNLTITTKDDQIK
jgi:hypothetical protein